ncbi:MAG: hypothetical protein AAFY15_08830 [Cyanobacteria bacterium J06648_11]
MDCSGILRHYSRDSEAHDDEPSDDALRKSAAATRVSTPVESLGGEHALFTHDDPLHTTEASANASSSITPVETHQGNDLLGSLTLHIPAELADEADGPLVSEL